MIKNIGQFDRIIRVILGLALLSLIVLLDSPIRWVGLVGLIMIGTAFIKFCPLYVPFKINTNKGASKR